MTLETQILKTFNSTFVFYYKAHAAHWNIQSRQFYSDHKLLQKIYENVFDSVDDLAEIIRTLQILMPSTLTEIIDDSEISDASIYDGGTGEEYFDTIITDLEQLVTSYQELETVTSDLGHNHICNFCQDRVRALEKFIWMIRSTLVGRT